MIQATQAERQGWRWRLGRKPGSSQLESFKALSCCSHGDADDAVVMGDDDGDDGGGGAGDGGGEYGSS